MTTADMKTVVKGKRGWLSVDERRDNQSVDQFKNEFLQATASHPHDGVDPTEVFSTNSLRCAFSLLHHRDRKEDYKNKYDKDRITDYSLYSNYFLVIV